MTLQFKRLHAAAQLPQRANPGDAGYDLASVEDAILIPGTRQLLSTGLAVAIPEGCYGRIAPRSGLAVKSGVDVLAGVVDSSYRGEIKVLLINHGQYLEIRKGQKIAQLILESIVTPESAWANELPESGRGANGFGSSDVKR